MTRRQSTYVEPATARNMTVADAADRAIAFVCAIDAMRVAANRPPRYEGVRDGLQPIHAAWQSLQLAVRSPHYRFDYNHLSDLAAELAGAAMKFSTDIDHLLTVNQVAPPDDA